MYLYFKMREIKIMDLTFECYYKNINYNILLLYISYNINYYYYILYIDHVLPKTWMGV